ncbi:MAG TPA: hypothetical protein VFI66_01060 [Gemmatimonadales bacterium]|nr:hypothetical protein [Gemmatimonadales bacterium]
MRRIIGVAAAALLAACSTVESPGSGLTQVEANALAEEVTTDAAALTEGSTFSSSSGMPLTIGPMTAAPVMPASSGSCSPTKSPTSPSNSDTDPVPDSVRFDFTGCTYTSGSYTASLGGTIDFIDPTPSDSDFALKTVYTDFSRSVTNTVTHLTRSAVENGSRTLSGSTSQLQRTETDFRTDYTFASGATASHVRTWSATFTADVAGSIKPDSLPSGDWNLAGTSTWTSGVGTYALSVTTNPQLHFNATCTVEPRLDAGTLAAVVMKNGVTTNVTIQFTACGQYTVTRS